MTTVREIAFHRLPHCESAEKRHRARQRETFAVLDAEALSFSLSGVGIRFGGDAERPDI